MNLSPSLLSADFGNLRAEAKDVEPLATYFHIDVMDGHFVDNLTIGPPVVNSLRRGLTKPFDIHLMIDHPIAYAPRFEIMEGDIITFHVEAKDDPSRTIETIHETGAKVGISLRPGTPIETIFPYLDQVDVVLVMSVEPGFGGQAFMPKAIERIRALRRQIGDRTITIEVDGGINLENVRDVVEAGATLIVAGSAIFKERDRIVAMRALIDAAQRTQ
ncbi:ribulose-phosphate 3-epimerase [Candidatus Bipolaricaulota bacterium]|nr:ribulose-phosphate 3-epimerase [Candidatus Bipolaricaulota bacterium]